MIFPLSSPTSRCEANPKDLIEWTKGKAIVATGSPFAPIEYAGKTYPVAQCNNVYIFPGVGLGVVASHSPKVTEAMFIRAAQILSNHSPMAKDPTAGLFPKLETLRNICREIAIGVIEVAQEEGLISERSPPEIERIIMQTCGSPVTRPTGKKAHYEKSHSRNCRL